MLAFIGLAFVLEANRGWFSLRLTFRFLFFAYSSNHLVAHSRWYPRVPQGKWQSRLYADASVCVTHLLGSYVVTGYAMPTMATTLEFYNSMWWVYVSVLGVIVYGFVTSSKARGARVAKPSVDSEKE